MSWINEIAGRAEDLLNKLDNGAATVLSKDIKKNKNKKPFLEQPCIASPTYVKRKTSPPPVKKASPVRTAVPNTSEEKVNHVKKEDERLLNYLNDSAIDINSIESVAEVKQPLLTQSQQTQDLSIQVEEISQPNGSVNWENENELLRNEVRSLNSEISLLLARTKSSERESALSKSILSKKESDLIVLEREVLSLKQRLSNIESENAELYNENICLKKSSKEEDKERASLHETECKLSQFQLEAQRKEDALKGDIASLRIRIGELEQISLKEKSEYAKELSDVNARLSEARKELEDYRTKAQRTLSEKEKLITELKKEGAMQDSTDVIALELQQLREGRDQLEAELEEVRDKLVLSRKEELEAERRLEGVREEATAALRSAQARLAEETARRLAAEEHSTSHAEELSSVREELWRQVGSLNSRLKERERELSRLRRQLSERVVTRPEPELTAALVQKQEAIEQMTIEINQLRLQLDRAKITYGQDLAKRCQAINVNDTDDAKAQLPSFMLHGRFDRSVKRAYSCVDRLSRVVFLRRHPFARVLLFSYLVKWLTVECISIEENCQETIKVLRKSKMQEIGFLFKSTFQPTLWAVFRAGAEPEDDFSDAREHTAKI